MKIPLAKPYIPCSTLEKISELLDSGFLTEGKQTQLFEDEIKNITQSKHAIATTSCTTGLEISLKAFGINSEDEVIIPDFTYPATAHAVLNVGAKLKIVDIDLTTMNINYDDLEKSISNKTKFIIPVSLFGNPLDWDKLSLIKEKYSVTIIEDAACSLGSKFKRAPTGSAADVTVFSFHPRKIITTGEGGMITTNNEKIAKWIQSYKKFGLDQTKSIYEQPFVQDGSNYKMSDLQSCLGLAQLKEFKQIIKQRIEAANYYKKKLTPLRGIIIPQVTKKGTHCFQSFIIRIKNRNACIDYLSQKEIGSQIGTFSLHSQPVFKNCYSSLDKYPNSIKAFEESLALPLYYNLTIEEQNQVIQSLKEFLK